MQWVKTLTPSGYKMGDKFTLTVGDLTAIGGRGSNRKKCNSDYRCKIHLLFIPLIYK
jgi:hypothetical protein